MESLFAGIEVQPVSKVTQRGVRAASILPLAFACLATCLSLTAGAGGGTAEQSQAWKALEQRWSTLIAQRRQPDVGKWSTLETDLRAFATRYDLHLEEHAKKARPVPVGAPLEAAFAECPPRDDVPGYHGYLFPGPKGVCRYVCVPNEKK